MSYESWLELWSLSQEPGMSGPVMRAWPDGGPLLRQSALLVEVFSMIAEQVAAEAKSRQLIGGLHG